MAIQTLKADIAKEVNITARRNDSFQLFLEVKDSSGLMDLSGLQGSLPHYQAKMSIINQSGEPVLNIYSYYWKAVLPDSTGHPANTTSANSSQEGHWSGNSNIEGIDLVGQTGGTSNTKVVLTVPFTHMAFQSGDYKYDFQIRKNTSSDNTDETACEYTTWLFGKFTLNADITQI